MDKLLIWAFIEQIRFQCLLLLSEAQEVDKACRADQTVKVFGHLQNLLSAAANISKAGWGQKGRRTDDRKELRARIGLTEMSVFRITTPRNNFHHFDERLDRWWKESQNHSQVDLCVTRPIAALGGPDDTDRFREFDPESGDVVFWGERCNIRSLAIEAQSLLTRLNRAIDDLY